MRRRSPHPLFSAVLLGVLTLRALLPGGYMIGSGDGLAPTMQLCPGHVVAAHDMSTGEGEPGSPAPVSTDERPCPFAAFVPAAPLPAASLAGVRQEAFDTHPLFDFQGFVQPTIQRSQSPRAPPAHA